MRSNYFEALMKLKWFPIPPSDAMRYKYSSNKCKIFMSAKFQLKEPEELSLEAPVVTWLSRINAALLHHKCGTEMAFAPLQQAHAVFKIASVQQQHGKFHAAA